MFLDHVYTRTFRMKFYKVIVQYVSSRSLYVAGGLSFKRCPDDRFVLRMPVYPVHAAGDITSLRTPFDSMLALLASR